MKQVKEIFKDFEDSFIENIGVPEKRLEERLAAHIEDYLLTTITNLEECESPIEKLLAIEFNRFVHDSLLDKIVDVCYWHPQREVVVFEGAPRERKYRVDFMFELTRFPEPGKEGFEYLFAVECDGHEFHEKTKEQAARDRQKDRDLMQHGITVIRFTGSEIYEDPFGCAREAFRIMEHYIGHLYRLR